ncbi:FAD-dependent monooxygenase [Saccharothrix violaceirubra]
MKVQVLVVGSGLGGASTTLFLARLGIHVLGISKHRGTMPHPRATGQTYRTMELLRVGGVADEVRAGGATGGMVIRIAESLGGPVFRTIVHEEDEIDGGLGPEPYAMASQDHVEPVLVDRARELGAEVRFHTELRSLRQDADGVTALLLDRGTGEEYTVTADYAVGADGGRSLVRTLLGVGRQGPGHLATHIGVIFRGDVGADVGGGRFTLYYLRNPAFTGAFATAHSWPHNLFTVEYDPGSGQTPADFPPERCVDLLRVATDRPDLRPEITAITSWEMSAWVADAFRVGRVFLVGDAAKVTPPTGGLGGNTAIGDGYDVAWKLAAVLRGEAGPGLLDSYEAERRPYARRIVDGSFHNYVERFAPHLAGPDVPAAIDHDTLIMGQRCRSGAVLVEDDDELEDPRTATGRPGFRVPHVVVGHAGRQVSTVDFTGEWTLLTADHAAWRDAPVRVPELDDPEGLLARRLGTGPDGASLIRPDGVVAWRTRAVPDDPATTVTRVLDAVLSR